MTENDLQMYQAFKRVIEKGYFDLEGRAVIQAALLFKWFAELEPKLKKAIPASNEIKHAIKPLGKPEKPSKPKRSKKSKKVN